MSLLEQRLPKLLVQQEVNWFFEGKELVRYIWETLQTHVRFIKAEKLCSKLI